MNKISGVYLIKNTITNDCYVGSSVNVRVRWYEHRSVRAWKRFQNNKMYIDMQVIGKDKFSFKILEECDKSQLFIREQYYIDKLKPTYNSNRAFQTEEELKEQQREDSKKYYQAHKEQYAKTAKKWYQVHKEQYNEYRRQRYAKRKAEKLAQN